MKLRLGAGTLAIATSVLGLAPTAKATVILYDKDNVKFFTTGFAELDLIQDSTQNLGDVIGSAPLKHNQNDPVNKNGRFAESVRNSRLAFGVLTDRPGHVKGKGYIEFDLEGYDPGPYGNATTGSPSNSEAGYYNNSMMRVRHVYLQAEGDWWSVLAGQTWSLLGWQADYVPSTVSVAPITGTLYERTPQLTFMAGHRDGIQGAFSIERPLQRDAAMPNLDVGLRWHFGENWRAAYASTNGDVKTDSASIAVSGSFRQIATPNQPVPNADNTAFTPNTATSHKKASIIAVDAMLPLLGTAKGAPRGNTLALTGEWTKGQADGDEFPNWNGGIPALNQVGTHLATTQTPAAQPNLDTGNAYYDMADPSNPAFTLVQMTSWNYSLQYHLPQGFDSWLTVGYGTLLASNADKASTKAGTIYDRTQDTFVNVVHDFANPEMRAGLEWDQYKVHWNDNTYVTNNRIQLSTYYRF